jgi:hypothetical protein
VVGRQASKRRVAVAGAVLALAFALDFGDGAGLAARSVPPAAGVQTAFPPHMSRIVSARVHHTRIPVARNTNARRVGRALASLRPTWVTGLIRYAKGQHPDGAEIRAWRVITPLVRGASPSVQFDVTINAKQYRSGRELTKMMGRIRARLGNDGWFIDFFSKGFRKRPRMIRAAIASAHAHGEFIGGNAFGLAHGRHMPMRADFLSVQDYRHLTLNQAAVRRLARRQPVVYHLSNDPGRPRSGGCRFISELTSAGRQKLIRHRAKQQRTLGFRVSYPAFFPECFRERPGRGTGRYLASYNLFRDPPMRKTVRRLLDRYEGLG